MDDGDLAIVQYGLVDNFERILFSVVIQLILDKNDDAE